VIWIDGTVIVGMLEVELDTALWIAEITPITAKMANAKPNARKPLGTPLGFARRFFGPAGCGAWKTGGAITFGGGIAGGGVTIEGGMTIGGGGGGAWTASAWTASRGVSGSGTKAFGAMVRGGEAMVNRVSS
jgi:hypothetical protein